MASLCLGLFLRSAYFQAYFRIGLFSKVDQLLRKYSVYCEQLQTVTLPSPQLASMQSMTTAYPRCRHGIIKGSIVLAHLAPLGKFCAPALHLRCMAGCSQDLVKNDHFLQTDQLVLCMTGYGKYITGSKQKFCLTFISTPCLVNLSS